MYTFADVSNISYIQLSDLYIKTGDREEKMKNRHRAQNRFFIGIYTVSYSSCVENTLAAYGGFSSSFTLHWKKIGMNSLSPHINTVYCSILVTTSPFIFGKWIQRYNIKHPSLGSILSFVLSLPFLFKI